MSEVRLVQTTKIKMPEIPNNFLGIAEGGQEEAEVLVLPVPFEATTSYGHGTKQGPDAIIKASQQVELFDPDLGNELQDLVKITTLKPIANRAEMAGEAEKFVNKFLISLGGEHSITPELIRPYVKKYSNLSVLQIDAHTDLRDVWEGSKNSHACAMRRIQEQGIDAIVQVGIRNTAKEEQKYVKKENIFWGDKFDVGEVMKRLTHDVYLTFDVDGLDLSIMPATGTPEPGGLSYDQALNLLRAVAREKNLVGADFVELSPIKGIPAYDFLVAKLIYKLISFKFHA
ncbi:MAG: agmatinase [Candidatus Doudnabacteria bacterium]|nr:agmatinase [Candidatus Doudnabacteria bacterium]